MKGLCEGQRHRKKKEREREREIRYERESAK